MRMLLGCALAGLMVATAQADDKVDAKRIIGKWEPSEKKEKLVIEFTKDGKVIMTGDKKDETPTGTYTVDGNKMTVTLKFMGKERTDVLTITKLTDTELSTKHEGSD